MGYRTYSKTQIVEGETTLSAAQKTNARFTDIASWFPATTSAAQHMVMSLASGLTSFVFTHVLRSDVALEHDDGNGTSGQLLQSDGDGTTSWTTVSPLTDGDKGDITVSGGGGVWGIDNDAVTTVKILDANVTTAKIADNNVTTAKIADSNVTYAKIQDASANSVIGRAASSSGVVSEIALAASELMGRGSTGDLAAIDVGSGMSISGTTLGLDSALPTRYISNADQTGINHSSSTTITNLTFTPAANTTYLVKAYVPWENSSPTTNGGFFGFDSITGLGVVHFAGILTSSNTNFIESVPIDAGTLGYTVSTSSTDGNFVTVSLMFRPGGSPSGTLDLVARAETSGATLTVRAGASMEVLEVA